MSNHKVELHNPTHYDQQAKPLKLHVAATVTSEVAREQFLQQQAAALVASGRPVSDAVELALDIESEVAHQLTTRAAA
jgi:hypothetical protein